MNNNTITSYFDLCTSMPIPIDSAAHNDYHSYSEGTILFLKDLSPFDPSSSPYCLLEANTPINQKKKNRQKG